FGAGCLALRCPRSASNSSLEVLLTQPAASESESHVPDVVSE
ncbi:hypothetical protein Tco_1201012, partial [Tanacetum coccineum]